METKIEAIRREFQTDLREVEARAESGGRTETGMGGAKPPTSDGVHHVPYLGASLRPNQSTTAGRARTKSHI